MLTSYERLKILSLRTPIARSYFDRKDERIAAHWVDEGRIGPPPESYKVKLLRRIAELMGPEAFVETGTYWGQTTARLAPYFKLLHTIELDPELYKLASRRFASDPKIHVHFGDSGSELPRILEALDGPVLFWLDAHRAGSMSSGGDYVPIFAELDAIARHKRANDHVIVVDDAQYFVGTQGYPTVEAVRSHAQSLGFRNYNLHAFVMIFDNRGGLDSIEV